MQTYYDLNTAFIEELVDLRSSGLVVRSRGSEQSETLFSSFILADPTKEMTGDYDVLMEVGFANRWTYYIDKDGMILKIDKETNPATAGRDLTQTMDELGFPKI